MNWVSGKQVGYAGERETRKRRRWRKGFTARNDDKKKRGSNLDTTGWWFIWAIATIIIQVTSPGDRNTTATGTWVLIRRTRACWERKENPVNSQCALNYLEIHWKKCLKILLTCNEEVHNTQAGAVRFIFIIPTVIVSITKPAQWDTTVILALEAVRGTGVLVWNRTNRSI